jgi:hypothetical protein
MMTTGGLVIIAEVVAILTGMKVSSKLGVDVDHRGWDYFHVMGTITISHNTPQ